jgi:hypothetical protein
MIQYFTDLYNILLYIRRGAFRGGELWFRGDYRESLFVWGFTRRILIPFPLRFLG